jgi:hypothetical protein
MIKFPKRKRFRFCVLVIRIRFGFRLPSPKRLRAGRCFESKLPPYDFIHGKSDIEALNKEGILFDEMAPLLHFIAH